MGTTVGNLMPSINESVPEPLWVEFGVGKPEPGSADHWVANGRRAGLQREDAGRRDGGVRGADKGS